MNRPTLIALKTLAWLACLIPLARLVYEAVTNTLGPDPTAAITFCTGSTALNLLTISLAVTPLRRLSPRLNGLIKFRRLLGLFAFFYASLHLMTYVALYAGFDINTITSDVFKRRFISVGMIAWLLLLPLAATSTNWAIRKMGGKQWSRLHKLAYLAAVLGVVHYWWQVKPGVLSPTSNTVILAALLVARPIQTSFLAWRQRRRLRPA